MLHTTQHLPIHHNIPNKCDQVNGWKVSASTSQNGFRWINLLQKTLNISNPKFAVLNLVWSNNSFLSTIDSKLIDIKLNLRPDRCVQLYLFPTALWCVVADILLDQLLWCVPNVLCCHIWLFVVPTCSYQWMVADILLDQLLLRMPALEHAEVRQLLNGAESFTPDGKLIIGEAPEVSLYRHKVLTHTISSCCHKVLTHHKFMLPQGAYTP